MTDYFAAITFINLFSLFMLFILIKTNSVISNEQKKNFFVTTGLIFVICIMEILTIVLDGSALKYRFFHIASNFLGFSLTPLVYFTLGNTLLPSFLKKQKIISPFSILWIIYSVWMLFALVIGKGNSVFYVNKENSYSRAGGFPVYIALYFISLLYFLVKNISFSIRFWKNNGLLIILNFIFVLCTAIIQMLRPDIQVTWIGVIISITIYFTFHTTLYQMLDSKTFLFNRSSFEKSIKNLKKDAVIFVAEIDNFEKFKKNYGRKETDRAVLFFSKMFYSFFKKYGTCYRTQDNEFLVFVKNIDLDFDLLAKNFYISFIKNSLKNENSPLISLGFSKISDEHDMENAFGCINEKKREFSKIRLDLLF